MNRASDNTVSTIYRIRNCIVREQEYEVKSHLHVNEFSIQMGVIAHPVSDPFFNSRSGDNQINITRSLDSQNEVRFGPQFNILMREKSKGLGTLLIKCFLEDLRDHYDKFSGANVLPVSLTRFDAAIDMGQNMARRTKFYQKLGFHVSVDHAGDGLGTLTSLDALAKPESISLKHGTQIVKIRDLPLPAAS